MQKIFKNRSTFSAAFCVLRWVSFKSPSLFMQSNSCPFSKFNDLHITRKRVGKLANCETLIPLFLFYCRISFVIASSFYAWILIKYDYVGEHAYFHKERYTFNIKICIIEVYLMKYYFDSHLIYKWRYYRQMIFNQLNIMVFSLDKIIATVSQFYEKSMWSGCASINYGNWSIDFA